MLALRHVTGETKNEDKSSFMTEVRFLKAVQGGTTITVNSFVTND